LPLSVAEELKTHGEAAARHYDEVTVLFSDFKDFSRVSKDLSPQELVEALDRCFRQFDEISAQYGLEKIKTIGREARLDMEELFGRKVYLETWVKVKSGWADDERALRSLGYIDDL